MVGDNVAGLRLDVYGARALAVLALSAKAIQEDFHALEARRFGAHGPGWPSLSPATVQIKRRRGMPQPETPMYGTGDLMFSLAGTNKFTVFTVSPAEIVMGTSAPYAQYHQVGPRQIRVFGRGHAILPQRKVVDITEADAARWAAIVSAALWAGM